MIATNKLYIIVRIKCYIDMIYAFSDKEQTVCFSVQHPTTKRKAPQATQILRLGCLGWCCVVVVINRSREFPLEHADRFLVAWLVGPLCKSPNCGTIRQSCTYIWQQRKRRPSPALSNHGHQKRVRSFKN